MPLAGAMLMIEVDGEPATLDSAVEAVSTALRGEGLESLHVAASAEETAALWSARRALSPAHACLAEVFGLVMLRQGTLPGAHGIGMVKREFKPLAVEASTLALMRNVKTAFDPDGILNPGELLP